MTSNGKDKTSEEEPFVSSNPDRKHLRLDKMKILNSTSILHASSKGEVGFDFHQSLPSINDCEYEDYGLMISIKDGKCQFQLCNDVNYSDIHTDCYAPETLDELKVLVGGGSGVAVFAGSHPELGNLVMKHGGWDDLLELFALVTIENELNRRAKALNRIEAARKMQKCLPEFKMIYIGPYHIMDQDKELYALRLDLVKKWSLDQARLDQLSIKSDKRLSLEDLNKVTNSSMSIRLYEAQENTLSFQVDRISARQSLSVILPHERTEKVDNWTTGIEGDCYTSLKTAVDEIVPIMGEHMFKFTLAQKEIGGLQPKTGNQWLYEGKLYGPVLDNLVKQFVAVIRNLQKLTLPEEVNVVEQVRAEIKRFDENPDLNADAISDVADRFVGNAIKKNFHPEKGRQRFLRHMCKRFRDQAIHVTPEEELPAKHLGNLLLSRALMSDTFLGAPKEPLRINPHDQYWKNILREAVAGRPNMSRAALQQIWTCGLTDAGIHNLFINEHELYLFDLGEPQLQSLPGFLTKFLFSFFHTLGMEDHPSNKRTWVRRFDIVGDKLAITTETQKLLSKAYDAFGDVLDGIINEVLDGDQSLRFLLLQYVTLQLLSDASFCLKKWQHLGGGISYQLDQSSTGPMEKWLWRALWDVYVAFDVNSSQSWKKFHVQHVEDRISILEGKKSINKLKSFMDFSASKEDMTQKLFGAENIDESLIKYLDSSDESSDGVLSIGDESIDGNEIRNSRLTSMRETEEEYAGGSS